MAASKKTLEGKSKTRKACLICKGSGWLNYYGNPVLDPVMFWMDASECYTCGGSGTIKK